jgi:hypothetical protein
LIAEFVGAIICTISPRAISTDEGEDGFGNFGEFSDILFIIIVILIPYIYNRIFIND